MKRLKVSVKFTMKGDEDSDTIQEEIYQRVQELMEEGDLDYQIDSEDEEDEEEY